MVLQWLKGRTAHHLLLEFPHLKKQFWGRHLWARGYFCCSSGNVTDDVIAKLGCALSLKDFRGHLQDDAYVVYDSFFTDPERELSPEPDCRVEFIRLDGVSLPPSTSANCIRFLRRRSIVTSEFKAIESRHG
jgi:hypothetical protein